MTFMNEMLKIIKRPVFREKRKCIFETRNKYAFDVILQLTKLQTWALVETIFFVRANYVNLYILLFKSNRKIFLDFKRIIVTLFERDKITKNIFYSILKNILWYYAFFVLLILEVDILS